ncbi:MAG: hypothetical protein RBT52_01940 [Sulfurimonas sp.]|jgi:hypothetical protein|nr:hypothetical protein [Sulfurimonas sp.]
MSYISKEALNQKIAHIKNMGVRMDKLIHEAACSCLHYLNCPEIQDTGFASRLIEAMPKSARRETLKAWFMKYGKLQEKKGILVFLKRKDITSENWQDWVSKGEEHPFWEAKEKAAAAQLIEMDAEEAFIALFKRLAKADKLEHQELFSKAWDIMPDTVKNKVMA